MTTLLVSEEQEGGRLDLYLASHGGEASRSHIQKLIKAGKVLVNGVPASASKQPVQNGDRIEFHDDQPVEAPVALEPVLAPLEVHYEDEELLIVYKPPGLATHPSAGHFDRSLVHWLLGRFSLAPGSEVWRPGIVHRLDVETSGLLVVAKTSRSLESLGKQFKEHTVARSYLALVWGSSSLKNGTIDKNISINPTNRKKMSVNSNGRNALTRWRVVEELYPCSLLKCTLETGRTHQIRVHMSSVGLPLVGDLVYGKGERIYKNVEAAMLKTLNTHQGQLLHAYRLELTHPVTGIRLKFYRRPPRHFQSILNQLGSTINFESSTCLSNLP